MLVLLEAYSGGETGHNGRRPLAEEYYHQTHPNQTFNVIKTKFHPTETNGRTAALAIRALGAGSLTKDATKRRRPTSSPASTGMWPIMGPYSRLIPPSTEGI